MPCPYPGMDPYLEDPTHWSPFQQNLVAALYQSILSGLSDRYRARIASRQYTTELVLFTSITRESQAESFVEIRERKDNALVTLVDCVSPSNRNTLKGKEEYLATRMAALSQKAAVVEIDLVTQGKPPVEFDRSTLPEHVYSVTLTRQPNPNRHQVYPLMLEKRLPPFKVPLAADDRDSVIDLQLVFARAYESGHFSKAIDHTKTIIGDVVLSADQKAWLLKQVITDGK